MEYLPTLIAALLGGAIGSGITAAGSLSIARSSRRESAAVALWDYHFALVGFVASQIGEVRDDEVSFQTATFVEVRKAHRTAYPYAGYLRQKAHKELFRDPWLHIGGSRGQDLQESLDTAAELDKYAALLESELRRTFPRRRCDLFARPRA